MQKVVAQAEKEARIDEVKKLHETRWVDIAYDIPKYLNDRLAQLNKDLRGGEDVKD